MSTKSWPAFGIALALTLSLRQALGALYVLFIGEKELKQGKVKLRDMSSGKEEMLNVEDVVKKLG